MAKKKNNGIAHDPALYQNTRGWLRIKASIHGKPPIFAPVDVQPIMQCGQIRLQIKPIGGAGTTVVWCSSVWFADSEINECEDTPDDESWNFETPAIEESNAETEENDAEA